MKQTINIGIIGDYDEKKISHPATNSAIRHAADYLAIKTGITWLPTPSFTVGGEQKILKRYDAIWASSGSPYESMAGAIRGIRAARETGQSFIGT